MYNIAFGTLNDLKIVLDGGTVVDVEDVATDPAVLNGLETRVAALENQKSKIAFCLIFKLIWIYSQRSQLARNQ